MNIDDIKPNGRPDLSEAEAKAIIEAVLTGGFDYYDLMALTETATTGSVDPWRADRAHEAE